METNDRNRVLTFFIDEHFDVALRMVRRALAMEGLRVPQELSTSDRVRQELGVTLRENVILYVDDPVRLLEATVVSPAGSLFVPEPVVLATGAGGCTIHLRCLDPLAVTALPRTMRAAVTNLHERILAGIQRISLKHTAATQLAAGGAVLS